MPSATYTPLANITLGSIATSVTFSSISGSYRDLILVANFNNGVTGTLALVQLNDDTGSNYTMVGMRGNGSGAASYTISAAYGCISYAGGTSGNAENAIAQFMDYSATDKHKTWLVRSNNADTKAEAMANRWANTAAVTKIKLYPSDSTYFTAGSTFALYGIAS